MSAAEKGSERRPTPMELLNDALTYARRGWRVLPLHSIRPDGSCTCGKGQKCERPGKHPRFKGWQRMATTDEATIQDWWKRCPDANVGIATGAGSGLVVLDIDPRHGGDESLAELERRFGPLPVTLTVLTGGGGRHYLLAHPGNGIKVPNATCLGGLPGLDVRGDGGLIVAPPSYHAAGRRYRWAASASLDQIP